MTTPVQENVEQSRFELAVDGQVAFAVYRRTDDVVVILHVEAPPSLRGTGAADRLMRGIAEKVRAEGRKIRPHCGYASAWIRRHREHYDLLA